LFDRSQYEPKKVIAASLRATVRSLEPPLVSCDDAVELVEWFAEIERLGAAGKTLMAGRAAEGDAWQRDGARSPADWLAKRMGTTVHEARTTLEVAGKLPQAPGTAEALRAGALSARQAEAIAPAAAADPGAEQRLLAMAHDHGLQELRDECARVRAAADPDPAARRERIRRGRFWKRWTDVEGARRGSYSLPPEIAAQVEAAAQPFIDARLDEARRAGEHEPSEAYAADGLAAMAISTMDGDRPPSPSDDACARPARGGRGRKRLRDRRELFCIVNLESLVRGYLLPGETCEIPGVGPVALDVVHELFGDALLRIVIRDGIVFRTVVHAGRTANAVQETAVLVRQQGRCGAPGCDLPISEIDHRVDFVRAGAAPLDGLLGLCGHHHDLKTYRGHSWRREADGRVAWIVPDGAEHHERPPPLAV
jgi:hypothetical protein